MLLRIPAVSIYPILWLILFIIFIIKNRRVGIGESMLFLYFMSGLFSVVYYYIIYNLKLLRDSDIHIDALIYLVASIFICIFPFLHHSKLLSEVKIKRNNDDGFLLIFLQFSIPILSFLLFESFYAVLTFDVHNLAKVYEVRYESGGLKNVGYQFSTIGNFCKSYLLTFEYLWPIILFVCLSSKRKIKKYSVVPLMSIICSLIISYISASRVSLVSLLSYIIIIFYFFKNTLGEALYKKARRYIVIFVGTSALIMLVISLVRFATNSAESLEQWLFLYMGEGDIRFSQYAWDITKHSDGDTSFALFKHQLGFDTFLNYYDRREYYQPILGIPTYIFYTFVGDWFIDFGGYYTMGLCIILALIKTFPICSTIHIC